MSQLLQLKILQASTETVKKIASKPENQLTQKLDYKLPNQNTNPAPNPSNQSSQKMKVNITKNLLRNDHKQEIEILAPLNLPEIGFPEMKAFPKIDIQLPISAPFKIQTNPVNQKVQVQVNGGVKVNHENFKFTEPVDVLKKIGTAQRYQFQKPLGLKGSQGKKGEFFYLILL
jgi:hypothetical protein